MNLMAERYAIGANRLSELSSIISEGVERVSNVLDAKGLPYPSFQPDAPECLPPELSANSAALVAACDELKRLVQGPRETFRFDTQQDLLSLHIIVSFDIAKSIPIGGFATFEEIAGKTGLHEHLVRRVIRHATTMYIFCEPSVGQVWHTAGSILLAQDENFKCFLDVNLDETWSGASQTVKALKKWPRSQSYAHSGFSHSAGGETTLFEHLKKSPERATKFANGLSVYSSTEAYSTDHLIGNSLFSTLKAPATVVDVGGSIGQTMKDLVMQYPSLNAIVQDLSDPIANHIAVPTEVEDKIDFLVHDFFKEQPVHNANIYLFRLIFHNWGDEDCQKILRSTIPALNPGSKIIVNEWCLPEPNTISKLEERRLRGMDMHMLALFNTCERDAFEWERMFKGADPGFQLLSVTTPPGPSLSILEFSWSG